MSALRKGARHSEMKDLALPSKATQSCKVTHRKAGTGFSERVRWTNWEQGDREGTWATLLQVSDPLRHCHGLTVRGWGNRGWVPHVGSEWAGEAGSRIANISSGCHRAARSLQERQPRSQAQILKADSWVCLCLLVLDLLNFQKGEEICLYLLSLDGQLSLLWEFDFHQDDLEKIWAAFSEALRLPNSPPAIGIHQMQTKRLQFNHWEVTWLDNLKTSHYKYSEMMNRL